MLKPPDEDTIRSMAMLENNGHFQRIVSWLEDARQGERDICESEVRYENLHQAQGSAMTLKLILKNFREASRRHADNKGRRA